MATVLWLAIFGMIFFYLVYLFKRFVQGKTKEQIRLEDLEKEELDLITSNNIFKSKAKKEKQLEDIRKEIDSLKEKINSHSDSNSKESQTSFPKAVFNHTKDITSEIKSTINQYKQNHKTSKSEPTLQNYINEDKIYEQVMIEIEEDKKIKGTWAKALALSEGNQNKAQSLYIQMRVDKIKNRQLEQASVLSEVYRDKIEQS